MFYIIPLKMSPGQREDTYSLLLLSSSSLQKETLRNHVSICGIQWLIPVLVGLRVCSFVCFFMSVACFVFFGFICFMLLLLLLLFFLLLDLFAVVVLFVFVCFASMLIFVYFVRLYTIDLYHYGYMCIVCFSVVKRLEIPKAPYKFPIIIIIMWAGLD